MLDMFNNLFEDEEMKLTLWNEFVNGEMEEDAEATYGKRKEAKDEELPF